MIVVIDCNLSIFLWNFGRKEARYDCRNDYTLKGQVEASNHL